MPPKKRPSLGKKLPHAIVMKRKRQAETEEEKHQRLEKQKIISKQLKERESEEERALRLQHHRLRTRQKREYQDRTRHAQLKRNILWESYNYATEPSFLLGFMDCNCEETWKSEEHAGLCCSNAKIKLEKCQEPAFHYDYASDPSFQILRNCSVQLIDIENHPELGNSLIQTRPTRSTVGKKKVHPTQTQKGKRTEVLPPETRTRSTKTVPSKSKEDEEQPTRRSLRSRRREQTTSGKKLVESIKEEEPSSEPTQNSSEIKTEPVIDIENFS